VGGMKIDKLNKLTEPEARLILSWISDHVDLPLARLISTRGATAALQVITISTVAKPSERRRLARLNQIESIEQLNQKLDFYKIKYLTPGNEFWPAQLDQLGLSAPIGLFIRGDERVLADIAVAIVGTRNASTYGARITQELAYELATIGYTIISGGALGIDVIAHHSTLLAQGTTICVQANGLDDFYPKSNKHVITRISENGAVISEYPPGRTPNKSQFLERNRIIAALAGGVVVVEAPRISGSLSTANHASKLSRMVMAFPGEVSSENSLGTNELIKTKQAEIITRASDVIELLAPLGQAPVLVDEIMNKSIYDDLSDNAKLVFETLPLRSGYEAGEIANRSGLARVEVISALSELQIHSAIRKGTTGWVIDSRANVRQPALPDAC
jgi:DNA processing protein